MKNIRQILATIFVLIFIAACDKDQNEPTHNLAKAKISSKWNVDNSSGYESFEFNESGNYIIVKNTTTKSTNDQVVLFGSYEIRDEKTIVLTDFGTLTISEIDENSISFSIQLISNPHNEVIINASKQEEIESSTNTDLLCKTWEVVSLGEHALTNFYVLFSKAGTYLLKSESEGEDIILLGTWTWCNTTENKLAFTIDHTLNCDGMDIIKDIQISSSSFIGIDMENGKPEEINMKSASSTKSTRLANQKIGVMVLGVEK